MPMIRYKSASLSLCGGLLRHYWNCTALGYWSQSL